jgi:hypothetical protein
LAEDADPAPAGAAAPLEAALLAPVEGTEGRLRSKDSLKFAILSGIDSMVPSLRRLSTDSLTTKLIWLITCAENTGQRNMADNLSLAIDTL